VLADSSQPPLFVRNAAHRCVIYADTTRKMKGKMGLIENETESLQLARMFGEGANPL
jgi:hypothetical protein